MQIDKEALRCKIIQSKELTALEKRYLISLIEQDRKQKMQEHFCNTLLDKFTKRR